MEEQEDRSVSLSLPPRAEFLALLRTVTGGVASRMQLPLDAIDDLRLAVDEAVALLLSKGRSATRVEMRLEPDELELRATVGTDAPLEPWPPEGFETTLAWQVISGLTDGASITRSERGTPTITVVKRTIAPPPA